MNNHFPGRARKEDILCTLSVLLAQTEVVAARCDLSMTSIVWWLGIPCREEDRGASVLAEKLGCDLRKWISS